MPVQFVAVRNGAGNSPVVVLGLVEYARCTNSCREGYVTGRSAYHRERAAETRHGHKLNRS